MNGVDIIVHHLSGARQGQCHRFSSQQPITCGRSPHNLLRFDPHRDDSVSGHHATLRWSGQGLQVDDNGSANGTFVNGRRVEQGLPVPNGAVLEFGAGGPKVRVTMQARSAPPASAPQPSPAPKPRGRTALIATLKDTVATSRRRLWLVAALLLLGFAALSVGYLQWQHHDQVAAAQEARDRVSAALAELDSRWLKASLGALEEQLGKEEARLEEAPQQARERLLALLSTIEQLGEVATLSESVEAARRSIAEGTEAAPSFVEAARSSYSQAQEAEADLDLVAARQQLQLARERYREASRLTRARSQLERLIELAREQGADLSQLESLQARLDASERALDFDGALATIDQARAACRVALTRRQVAGLEAESDQLRKKLEARDRELDELQEQLLANNDGMTPQEARNKASDMLIERRKEARLDELGKSAGGTASKDVLARQAAAEVDAEEERLRLTRQFERSTASLVFILAETYVVDPQSDKRYLLDSGVHVGSGFAFTPTRILTAKSVALPWRFDPQTRALVERYRKARGFEPLVVHTIFASDPAAEGKIAPLYSTDDETVSLSPVTPGDEAGPVEQTEIYFNGRFEQVEVRIDHPLEGNLAVLEVHPEGDDDGLSPLELSGGLPLPRLALGMGMSMPVKVVDEGHRELAFEGLAPAELIASLAENGNRVELERAAPFLLTGGAVIDSSGSVFGLLLEGDPKNERTPVLDLGESRERLMREVAR